MKRFLFLGLALAACGGSSSSGAGGGSGGGAGGGSGDPCATNRPFGKYTSTTTPPTCPSGETPSVYDDAIVFGVATADGGTGTKVGNTIVSERWKGCEVVLSASATSSFALDLTYDPAKDTLQGSGTANCSCATAFGASTKDCTLTAKKP